MEAITAFEKKLRAMFYPERRIMLAMGYVKNLYAYMGKEDVHKSDVENYLVEIKNSIKISFLRMFAESLKEPETDPYLILKNFNLNRVLKFSSIKYGSGSGSFSPSANIRRKDILMGFLISTK